MTTEPTKTTEASGSPLERGVRRPGTYLPTPKVLGETADQCRELGILVGDTIIGREAGCVEAWNETRLTLLWLGQHVAVFREQGRTSDAPDWTEPDEVTDWTLECRRWRWAHNVELTGRTRSG